MNTTRDCPKHGSVKSIKPIEVTCKKCGVINEVFSDEVEKTHACSKCKAILSVKKS